MSTDSCGCGGTCPKCQVSKGDELFNRKALVAEKMGKMRALSPTKRGRKGKKISLKK